MILKRILKQIYWRGRRLFLSQPPLPPSPRHLLFVCKGNICRSPFAEAMARKRIPDGEGFVFRSAGIVVAQPEGCPRETLVAAERYGIDLSGHRSLQIDQELVAWADMVLVMEAWHYNRLRELFPKEKGKMFLLPLFDNDPQVRSDSYRILNIRDPYGRSGEDFMECFERIDDCLKNIFAEIRDAGGRPPGGGNGTDEWTKRR